MKEYYFEHANRIKFYRKDDSRDITYRKRYSSRWIKNPSVRVPFRVENYYKPTLFYNGIVDKNKDIDCGYDKIKRGIWRNDFAKFLKEGGYV